MLNAAPQPPADDDIVFIQVERDLYWVPRSVLRERGLLREEQLQSHTGGGALLATPVALPQAPAAEWSSRPAARRLRARAFDPDDVLAEEEEKEAPKPPDASAAAPKKHPVMPSPIAGGEADDALGKQQQEPPTKPTIRPNAAGVAPLKRSENNVHQAALGQVLRLRPYTLAALADDPLRREGGGGLVPRRKPVLPQGFLYETVPIFIQMFASEMIQRAADIFQDILHTVCGVHGGVVERVELRSESSFIAVVRTACVYDVIHSLRCRVLMDRSGFWYAEDLQQYAYMKTYCEQVRNLPAGHRYQLTDGLPCMPLVVELSRSAACDKLRAPPAPPSFDVQLGSVQCPVAAAAPVAPPLACPGVYDAPPPPYHLH